MYQLLSSEIKEHLRKRCINLDTTIITHIQVNGIYNLFLDLVSIPSYDKENVYISKKEMVSLLWMSFCISNNIICKPKLKSELSWAKNYT